MMIVCAGVIFILMIVCVGEINIPDPQIRHRPGPGTDGSKGGAEFPRPCPPPSVGSGLRAAMEATAQEVADAKEV